MCKFLRAVDAIESQNVIVVVAETGQLYWIWVLSITVLSSKNMFTAVVWIFFLHNRFIHCCKLSFYLLLWPDLLHIIPWWWVTWGEDSSIEATIYIMLSFSPRYYCTLWKEIRRDCELGKFPWEGCSSDEWYSSNTLHSRADKNIDGCQGFELGTSLEYYAEVLALMDLRIIHRYPVLLIVVVFL